MLRKLVALMILGGLAQIRGALWIVIQLLAFWNSCKMGKGGSDDDLADTRSDQKVERRRVLSRTINPCDTASVDPPLSLGRDLVPFSFAVSHRII